MLKRKDPPRLSRLKELYDYNPLTGLFIHKKTSRKSKKGCIAGGKQTDGYISISVDGVAYRAHRLAWFLIYNTWPNEIDHRNRNKEDNRIANLRIATTSQNQINSDKSRSKKSGLPRGVARHRKRYQTFIMINGKTIHLGCFYTVYMARRAYRRAARKYFGEFAP